MFHKAVDLKFNEGTSLDVTFQSVAVKRYDTASLFGKYPQLEALKDNPAQMHVQNDIKTAKTSFLGKGMHINSEMKDFYVTANCHATQIQYRFLD